MIEATTVLGFIGSITAATLFFPQVWTAWKTKNTKGLSIFMIFLGMLNGIAWSTYGILRLDPFIYITNSVLFIATTMLLILKRRYG